MEDTGLYNYAQLVELPQQRRLLSLLSGMHRGLRAGSSHEFFDMAEYKAGDDISDIDWKTTARYGQPVIKRFEATAVLTAFLVVDAGSNMAATAAAGPPTTKQQITAEATRALASLCAARGDMLGLVVGNQADVETLPARSGVAHAQTLLRVAARARVTGPPSAFPQLLRRAGSGRQSRSLMMLITDRSQITPDIVAPLRRLQSRHQVNVLLADDFDPTVLPSDSNQLRDVIVGDLPEYVQTDENIALQWRAAVASQRHSAARILDQLRIPWAVAGQPADVLDAFRVIFERGQRQ